MRLCYKHKSKKMRVNLILTQLKNVDAWKLLLSVHPQHFWCVSCVRIGQMYCLSAWRCNKSKKTTTPKPKRLLRQQGKKVTNIDWHSSIVEQPGRTGVRLHPAPSRLLQVETSQSRKTTRQKRHNTDLDRCLQSANLHAGGRTWLPVSEAPISADVHTSCVRRGLLALQRHRH